MVLFRGLLQLFLTSNTIGRRHRSITITNVSNKAQETQSQVNTDEPLSLWLNKVRPVNSFISAVTVDDITSPSTMSASWLHVNSVTDKQQVWSFSNHLDLQLGLLCLHRWKIWWLIPKLLKSNTESRSPEAEVPPETYFLLSRFTDGTYLLLLPIIDRNMGFTLEGSIRTHSLSTCHFLFELYTLTRDYLAYFYITPYFDSLFYSIDVFTIHLCFKLYSLNVSCCFV